MDGLAYLTRVQKSRSMWTNLANSSAKVTNDNGITTVDLAAHFTDDSGDRNTYVGLRIRDGGLDERPAALLLYLKQPGGKMASCDICTARLCDHHEVLLQAASTLEGATSDIVKAVLANLPEFSTFTQRDHPLDFVDEDRLVFDPAAEKWERAVVALRPVRAERTVLHNYHWPEQLAERIPEPARLTGAVTDCSILQQLENLSTLRRRVFLLAGPPGTGKSATLARFAAERGVPHLTVNCPDQIELFRVGLEGGATVLQHSLLAEAVQHPCVVELVDLHRWTDRLDVLDAIEPLLNPTATRLQAYFPVTAGAIDVPIHRQAVIAATTNRPSIDFGAKWLDRMTLLPVGQLDTELLAADAFADGSRGLAELANRDLVQPERLAAATDELEKFAQLVSRTAAMLNRDPMLGLRHSWGTRAVREAVERRALGQPVGEIAVVVFAGKLLRDPALALYALSQVHGLCGWGKPALGSLPFGAAVTDEQLQEYFPELGGQVS
ncbi:DNA polymerase III delta prime subunit [Crossiella equi]|uniref:DNA polymerase III delta prime subunit n=1 Tax=Crossiella equi TaxID=130796 RepID=A0ABS5A3N6_9PSEU|nr:ATP-binding protein [Crossiella equi]MBP2471146.1 DNA polymerase III delta prime subunit [Crossiella equi]